MLLLCGIYLNAFGIQSRIEILIVEIAFKNQLGVAGQNNAPVSIVDGDIPAPLFDGDILSLRAIA